MSYTSDSIAQMNAKANARYKGIQKILMQLGKMQSGRLDKLIVRLHSEEFEYINCLECANCCRTISPAMTDSDVRRMADYCKMNSRTFIRKYLHLDHDDDYVFSMSPCPFLDNDNPCSIYDSRPRACREYPHTDRKRFHRILNLTARSAKVCPAVYNIIEKLKRTGF